MFEGRMRGWAVVVGLFALAVLVIAAQSVEQRAASARANDRLAAFEAVEDGRYAEAIPSLRDMAQAGNARAMLALARLYGEGRAVPRDVDRAVALYEGAAAAGLSEARLSLARLEEERARLAGDDDPERAERVVGLYREAAEAGELDAMIWIGEALLVGEFVEANPVAGSRWLLRAAESGSAVARMRVGELHRDGFGFPQDPVLAHAWLNLAAASFPLDQEERIRAIEGREELARSLRRDQLDRAREMVRQLFASTS